MNPFILLIRYNTIIIKLFLLIILHNCSFSSFSQGWTKKTDFPSQRYRATAFAIGDTGYVGLGLTPDKLERDFWKYIPDKGYVVAQFNDNNFLEYSPETNSWKVLKNFPGESKLSFIGFSFENKGYIGCGFGSGSGNTNELWEFDPISNEWNQKSDFQKLL